DSIVYSDRYPGDDEYIYRHVILPKQLVQYLPKDGRLMEKNEKEWQALGVQQSRGWEHYLVHSPEPHILLFRRP
ncbi:cyclin-dependent kinases regulatory subunit-like protein, partial [Ramicandelaber brevisporus]